MKRQRAQSLVEFAFVFPIFLLLTVGLLDLGRAVWHYNTLADAARQAARQRELGIMSPSLDFCNRMFSEPCTETHVSTIPSPPPTPPGNSVLVTVAEVCPAPPNIIVSYSFKPLFTFIAGFPWVQSAPSSTPSLLLAADSAVPLVPGVCS